MSPYRAIWTHFTSNSIILIKTYLVGKPLNITIFRWTNSTKSSSRLATRRHDPGGGAGPRQSCSDGGESSSGMLADDGWDGGASERRGREARQISPRSPEIAQMTPRSLPQMSPRSQETAQKSPRSQETTQKTPGSPEMVQVSPASPEIAKTTSKEPRNS